VVEPQQKMTDHDDYDTEAAPTEQASPPTTELPPASHTAASPEAWSLDDTADLDAPTRHSHLVWSALVALVVAIAVALIFLATTLFGSGSPKPVEPKVQPTTTAPVAAPPPPPVTVTATPTPTVTVTAPAPTPVPSTADWQFLNAISDIAAAPSPAYAITHAHAVCSYAAQHPNDYTGTIRFVQTTTVWTANQAFEFADVAMQVYCPSALPPDF
jgi:hypothetical protein